MLPFSASNKRFLSHTTGKKPSLFMFIAFISIGIGMGFLLGNLGGKAGLLLFALLIGVGIVITCIANPVIGFYTSIFLSFFIYYIKRLAGDDIPLGTAMEILIWATFLGILLRKIITREETWAHANTPITYAYAFFTLYMVLELLNPNVHSFAGWFRIFRKFLESYVFYLIALYAFKNLKSITFFFKFLIGILFVTALYACYQQWVGLPAFEYHWVVSDPVRFGLLFQYGTIRKFSFLSDPVGLGVLMAVGSLFSFVLAITLQSTTKKIMLLIAGAFMFMALAFSGIRTATAMVPTGLLIFGIMTIRNKKALMLTSMSALFFLVLIFGPFHGNSTIERMRTAFSGSEDPSLNVRNVNRKRIQPFIYSHPIGGGLAASGELGRTYNPGNPLAGFPPDSGYMQAVLDSGWMGLAIILCIYFIILKWCTDSYYHVGNRKIKNYYVAITTTIFALVIADLTQDAIGQFTVTYIFYPLVAVAAKLRYFDPAYT